MEKTITGSDALERMIRLRKIPNAYFSMIHFTCNLNNPKKAGLVRIEKCRLRPALKSDTFSVDGNHYLTYEDLEKESPRMCFKRLIRYVAFPPEYEFLKVNWL